MLDKNWALVHTMFHASLKRLTDFRKSIQLQFETKISFTVVLLYPVHILTPLQNTSGVIFVHYDIETLLKALQCTGIRKELFDFCFESMTLFYCDLFVTASKKTIMATSPVYFASCTLRGKERKVATTANVSKI